MTILAYCLVCPTCSLILSNAIMMMMMKMTRDNISPLSDAEIMSSDVRVRCDAGLRASLMTSSVTSSSSSWQHRVLLRMSLIINDVIVARSAAIYVIVVVTVDTDY